MESSEFDRRMEETTRELDKVIDCFLPEEKGAQKTVLEAMNYSVRAGGKRLRPMLMLECFRLCGGQEKDREFLNPFLAAIEMIHTYSLVHDDLPAMDNDEYRRGKKTTWAVYGDAMGILAGDGLLNYGFETATKAFFMTDILGGSYSSGEYLGRAAKALSVLATKAGVFGMIGGQTADIQAEEQTSPVTEEQLLFIHEHKTAALIQASMVIGAIIAGGTEEQIAALEKCGYNIGIAFQIQDDILDVVGDSKELGKTVGSDVQNNKQTYVTIKGLEKSAEDVAALTEEAVKIFQGFAEKNEFLEQLVLKLINRRK